MNLTVKQNIQLLFEDTKKEMVTPRFGTSKEKIYPEKVREKEKIFLDLGRKYFVWIDF